MSMDAVSAHLVRLEIFHGLKPLQITEIARHAERVVYKPGQALIEDGKAGDAAIIVVYLAVLTAVGVYFSRRQRNLDEYFLARQSMTWLPVGLSPRPK